MTEPRRRIEFCPHCSNTTPQVLALRQRAVVEGYHDDGGEPRADEFIAEYFVLICQTCERPLIYVDFQSHAKELRFDQSELFWPEPDELHDAVPDAVQEIYTEAARIRALAPSAYATQIRRRIVRRLRSGRS